MEQLNGEETKHMLSNQTQREYEISSIIEYDTDEEISPR